MTYTEDLKAPRHTRKAFTIIEIAIVLAIAGLIIAGVLPMIRRTFGQAQRSTTNTRLREAQTAIMQYQLHTGKYPTRLADLVTRPAEPKAAGKWQGPYLDDEPTDGWGNPLKYEPTGRAGKPYELYSFGPNGPGAPQEEWISVWSL